MKAVVPEFSAFKKVTIYTANFGQRDIPAPPLAQSIPTQWFLITDAPPDERTRLTRDGWKVVHVESEQSARSLSRIAKLAPWKLVETSDWDDTRVWIDASVKVVSPTFAEEATDSIIDGCVNLHLHPTHGSVLAELVALISNGTLACADARAYAERLLRRGGSLEVRPFSTGYVAYRMSDDVAQLLSDWWRALEFCSNRDQLALELVIAANRTRIVPLHRSIYDSGLSRRLFETVRRCTPVVVSEKLIRSRFRRAIACFVFKSNVRTVLTLGGSPALSLQSANRSFVVRPHASESTL